MPVGCWISWPPGCIQSRQTGTGETCHARAIELRGAMRSASRSGLLPSLLTSSSLLPPGALAICLAWGRPASRHLVLENPISRPRADRSIWIYDAASISAPGCEKKQQHASTGIDAFIGVVLHESVHLNQIAAFDALIPLGLAEWWTFGWSFGDKRHNHWHLGADGLPGLGGENDDFAGVADELFMTNPPPEAVLPYELGHDGDVALDHSVGHRTSTCTQPPGGGAPVVSQTEVLPSSPVRKDWPLAFPVTCAQAFDCCGKLQLEHEAYLAMPEVDHTYAEYDWSSPGKNFAAGACQ